jgi:hypothetical protein
VLERCGLHDLLLSCDSCDATVALHSGREPGPVETGLGVDVEATCARAQEGEEASCDRRRRRRMSIAASRPSPTPRKRFLDRPDGMTVADARVRGIERLTACRWDGDFFLAHGLHRMRGTVRYPEAA